MTEWDDWRVEQAHAYLERVRRMGADCAGLRRLVEDARANLGAVRGLDYSRGGGSQTAGDDAIVNEIAAVQESVASYVAKLAEYEDERHRAAMAVDRMPDPTEARVLRLRYLLGWKWENICVEVGYSYDGIMKLRRRALVSFYEVMPRDAIPRAL